MLMVVPMLTFVGTDAEADTDADADADSADHADCCGGAYDHSHCEYDLYVVERGDDDHDGNGE